MSAHLMMFDVVSGYVQWRAILTSPLFDTHQYKIKGEIKLNIVSYLFRDK